jgi:hypothetical protein
MSRIKGSLDAQKRRSIDLWKDAYTVTLKNKKAFAVRLKELETWDNCNGHEDERKNKIAALKELL